MRDICAGVAVFERSAAPLRDLGGSVVLHPATVRYARPHGLRDLDEISQVLAGGR
jgi:hypothetical protein